MAIWTPLSEPIIMAIERPPLEPIIVAKTEVFKRAHENDNLEVSIGPTTMVIQRTPRQPIIMGI
jgi:hypothetical protein